MRQHDVISHPPDGSDPTEPYRDRELLRQGKCYEFTHGPSSTEVRRKRGVLEEMDEESGVYVFRMTDGSRVSLVWHEVQAPQLLDNDDC